MGVNIKDLKFEKNLGVRKKSEKISELNSKKNLGVTKKILEN